jgi:WD40-like Beta Propeller Repeat
MRETSFIRIGWLAGILIAAGALTPALAAAQSSNCPNEALRSGVSANLPDCRAYEMVSPPNKNGGEVDGGLILETEPGPMQAAADGEAVTYASETTFTEAEPHSALGGTQYLSVRGPDGWSTRALTPRQALPYGRLDTSGGSADQNLYQGFSEDLSHGFLLANEPAPVAGAPAGYFNPYLEDTSSGAFSLLSSAIPPVQPPGNADAGTGMTSEYAGVSADGSHVIFEVNDALTPKAVPGRVNLYEWAGGHLELVSILPGGTPDAGGGLHVGDYEVGLGFGGPNEENEQGIHFNYSHAISTEGTHVFWTGSGSPRQVYMHELTSGASRTVEVSASQKTNGSGPGGGDPNGPESAHYWTASADGSLVYFTSSQQLTNDSTAEPGASDLYQYNTHTGALIDLTVDPNPGQSAAVQGVMGASEDGSYVYFAASGALTPDAPVNQNYANLYVWHAGSIRFIATLSIFESEAKDWDQGTRARTSRVSPDGQYLAFQSDKPLTGYDNYGVMEVFEYDAGTDKLVCASCNPTGVPPTGESLVPEALHAGQNTLGWQTSTVQQRYLLDDGRLFFQSQDALLAQASNATQNIYEFEPDEVADCRDAGTGGCLYLISTGTSSEKSYFVDASSDGRDVFFITRQQLVPRDGDEALDLYDAREDGGFSETVPPQCAGEACRPPVSVAPSIYGAPSSATFSGLGNLTPAVTPTAPVVKKKTVAQERAEKLAKALKACEKKARKKRAGCGKQVRKRYGRTK